MKYDNRQLWARFQQHYRAFPELGLSIDISRMNFPDDWFEQMTGPMHQAFAAMTKLEQGAIANPDEDRMVGHYWLRTPDLAPTAEIREQIEQTVRDVIAFAADVHSGKVAGSAGAFENLLIIGIGGSALGPQFIAHALGHPESNRLTPYFFDNTDPDGMDRVLARLKGKLGGTMCLVISKSGGTKETRNGMLEAKRAYEEAGIDFSKHTVAITGVGSQLDQAATTEGWIRRFPMWDWVGGRTSVLSAVGLLPAALQGIDIEELLRGASVCDKVTRAHETENNPSALLALMWHYIGNGKGERDMVILPYKDRLELFSKYLQQLIMESLGKELDLDGKRVNQGIAVYGNKGSTDQHAYVQQLRDGVNNFFVTFIQVLRSRSGDSMTVDTGVTSGDYLFGFLMGTRQALYESDRESITLCIDEVSAFSVGVLIALYERAVGLYASLVNVNAYHQPGVEAGKKAAEAVLAIKAKLVSALKDTPGQTCSELAESSGTNEETIFKICEHLVANGELRVDDADVMSGRLSLVAS